MCYIACICACLLLHTHIRTHTWLPVISSAGMTFNAQLGHVNMQIYACWWHGGVFYEPCIYVASVKEQAGGTGPS